MRKSLLLCVVLGVFGVLAGPVGSALATGDVNEAACPNEASPGFRAGLPDCRAYELVTPAEKLGALVEPVLAATVAADGSSLAGRSQEGFAGIENDELIQAGSAYYRFARSASGWVTTPLEPYRGFLESIGVGAEDSVWGPAELQSDPARLRLRAADGSLSEIGPVWPPASGSSSNPFAVLGVAGEASNGVLFTVRNQAFLWPFDSTIGGGRSLYEYTGTGNAAPSLVGVSGGVGSTALVSQCGTLLGNGGQEERNAVSEDGSRVFFTAVGADRDDCGGTEPAVDELFARVGGSQTVAISEPSSGDCPACDLGAPRDAAFVGASADGSRVFFTTTQALLGSDTSTNLYEYDFDAPAGQSRVVRVSGGDGTVSEPTAEVEPVTLGFGGGTSRVFVSEDGSHVYFTARGVLTTNPNGEGERAQPGAENFYVYERDAQYPGGRTVFIAGCGDVGNAPGAPRESQVTPDGDFLVFTSACHLTPGDTSSARQVFQYDAQSGSLVRVSIGLEGYNDDGNVSGEDSEGDLDARIVVQEMESEVAARGGALARTQSDDGAYVFFQSPVGLTAQALNLAMLNEEQVITYGEAPIFAENVYEYHDGRVSLIGSDSSPAGLDRSGSQAGHPVLIGVSASGGDVFFRTGDQLVPQDVDTQIDFYDARVGGGFPAPVAPVGCVGDECQGASLTAPVFGSPSSAGFSGAGNIAPAVSTKTLVKPRSLTVAQRLARALAVCSKQPTRRRRSCEARARKRYARAARVRESDRRGK